MTASPAATPPERRPWGVWASLAWYVLIFEIVSRIYDFLLVHSGLKPIIDQNHFFRGLSAFTAWGIQFLVLVLAVRMTRIPLPDYLAWKRPRLGYVALGIVVVLALLALKASLIVAEGAGPAFVREYRQAMAAGASPWWYVLHYWPAFILAPFVEESFFRGFLWRGVQSRLGNGAAFAITTLVFAGIHFDYWARGGVVDPSSVVEYLIFSSFYGLLRWGSGSTIVTMMVHCVDNIAVQSMDGAMSAVLP
jgi:membrane protease YdiL (CAAX protease family)